MENKEEKKSLIQDNKKLQYLFVLGRSVATVKTGPTRSD
jgi:hypothetical protein